MRWAAAAAMKRRRCSSLGRRVIFPDQALQGSVPSSRHQATYSPTDALNSRFELPLQLVDVPTIEVDHIVEAEDTAMEGVGVTPAAIRKFLAFKGRNKADTDCHHGPGPPFD